MKSRGNLLLKMGFGAMLTAFAGCGGNSGVSCLISGGGTCYDLVGSSFTGNTTTAQSTCSQYSATLDDSDACTSTNRVGTCAISAGSVNEIDVRYYSPNYASSTAAQAACTTGTFTPN